MGQSIANYLCTSEKKPDRIGVPWVLFPKQCHLWGGGRKCAFFVTAYALWSAVSTKIWMAPTMYICHLQYLEGLVFRQLLGQGALGGHLDGLSLLLHCLWCTLLYFVTVLGVNILIVLCFESFGIVVLYPKLFGMGVVECLFVRHEVGKIHLRRC